MMAQLMKCLPEKHKFRSPEPTTYGFISVALKKKNLTKSNFREKGVYFIFHIQVIIHHCEEVKAGTSIGHVTPRAERKECTQAHWFVLSLISLYSYLHRTPTPREHCCP